MTRSFILGNGSTTVCFDQHYQIRDFYFPYVGQENHSGSKVSKFGIWVDGMFSWFDDSAWEKKLSYQHETLVSNVIATNAKMLLDININDAVHHEKDIFLRRMIVKNNASVQREIRIFCHQHFKISESHIGDTAYYNPLLHAMVHYKGRRYFLINGCYTYQDHTYGISSYAAGVCGEWGKEGTYKDAEDGKLSNNPIEHGSVDSAVSFNVIIPGNDEQVIYYWICVGKKQGEVTRLNEFVLKNSPQSLLEKTSEHWVGWVNNTKFDFLGLSDRVIDLFKRSLLVIRAQIDNNGAIIASVDSDTLFLKKDTYAYMWPRDGALIARSLDRSGYRSLSKKFFKFCCDVLTDEGYLFHKYRPDGSLGSSWHSWLNEGNVQLPIQEDQIALVLDALWKHFLQYGDKKYCTEIFDSFIRKASKFMFDFIDKKTGLIKESYDLWEEKLGIHTFTCATVYAGLRAAGNFEKAFGDKGSYEVYYDSAEKLKEAILKYL